MKSSAVAIIPARSGSKSIKDKNLVNLGGHPLLAYSIAAAKLSKRIDRVLLSTDSERYAEIGRQYGADAPFLRSPELSADHSTDREFMVHAMTWMRDHESHLPEFWVHLRPTTPLRDPRHVDEAVMMLEGDAKATALRSAHLSPESPFKWFRRSDEGYLVALTAEDTRLDRFNLPRQAYPPVYTPDGYVDVVRSSFVLSTPLLHGNRVLAYNSPRCTEVDSIEELELLEWRLRKYGSPLIDYLQAHKM